MEDLLRQAQDFSARLDQLKEELARRTVEGSAGGGMVKVTADGLRRIRRVQIEPSLLKSPDPEMIEDLVCAATNQALEAAQQMAAEASRALTGGMSIPGLEGLMGG
jgi:hypothetical protein